MKDINKKQNLKFLSTEYNVDVNELNKYFSDNIKTNYFDNNAISNSKPNGSCNCC